MPPLSPAPLSLSRPWRGALIAEEGGERTAFSLHPSGTAPASSSTTVPLFGLTITMADAAPQPVHLLDGAPRALVGLVESAQLLFDARVRSGRLMGRWWRRDASGEVIAQGELEAGPEQPDQIF